MLGQCTQCCVCQYSGLQNPDLYILYATTARSDIASLVQANREECETYGSCERAKFFFN